MSIPKKKMIEMYTTMVKIRMFETKVSELFAANKIPGVVHLYIGEEAVATGVCATLWTPTISPVHIAATGTYWPKAEMSS